MKNYNKVATSKKIIPFLVILYITCTQVSAQQYYKHAIGLRIGTVAAATYKVFLAKNHAIEGQVGLRFNNGFMFAGMYQFHGDIGYDTGFRWYAGAGVSAGFKGGGFGAGLLVTGGAEYKFRLAPIAISLDYQPVVVGTSPGYAEGGVTVRYTFE
jgi:hypothetical protein